MSRNVYSANETTIFLNQLKCFLILCFLRKRRVDVNFLAFMLIDGREYLIKSFEIAERLSARDDDFTNIGFEQFFKRRDNVRERQIH